MGNLLVKLNDPKWIKQPNRVTYSSYNCSEVQENFMTLILFCLQAHLTKEYDLKSNLFNQPIVEISLKKLGDRRNHKRFFEEAVKMRAIGLNYYFKDEKDHLIQRDVGVIISVERNYTLKTLTLTLNKEAIKLLTFIGTTRVGNYTNYSLSVALKIRGLYSKRIYKLVSSWKNKGGFQIYIDHFKRILSLEGKYKNIAQLKKLLNTTRDKLKKNGDIYYDFSMDKLNGEKKATRIKFKIIIINPTSLQKVNTDKIASNYNIVRNLLDIWFPIIENSFTNDTAVIILENGKLEVALKRLKNMKKQYDEGVKSKQDCINNIKTNCLKDWGIKR